MRPTEGQIDDLLAEMRARTDKGQRALVTTLTKKMAEDLADYLQEMGIKVHYLHSEIDTLERIEILRDLRLGVYDVVVGINLLREGLDLPEVSLVAILDADKEGFLRSQGSLIQTVGRAARHIEGHGHHVRRPRDRLDAARDRRDQPPPRHPDALQRGARHHADDIQRDVRTLADRLHTAEGAASAEGGSGSRAGGDARATRSRALIKDLESQMKRAAKELEFEKAANCATRSSSCAAHWWNSPNQVYTQRTRGGHRRRGTGRRGVRLPCAVRPAGDRVRPPVPPACATSPSPAASDGAT